MTAAVSRLSRRVAQLAPSQTLALAARAKALKAEGKPVISFSVGEPDFASPKLVGDAAKAAIDAGDTHYPPVPGTVALRQAIVDRVKRETGYDAELSQVLVSAGAKHTLYNLSQVLLDPGDEVVIPSPYWVSYPAQVELAGGRAVPVQLDPANGFRLDPVAIAAAMGPRCKALILNTPSNPSGAVASPEDVDAVVRLCLDREVVVISDEIYHGLLYAGAKHHSALSIDDPRVRDGVVLVDGVSKSFAMTGWRIGYCVGPTDIVKAASKIQSQSTSGACSIAQAAATAAINDANADAETMRDAFAKRRDVALAAFAEIPGLVVPEAKGAFYLFPDFSAYYGKSVGGTTITGSLVLSELLLEKANVAAVPGCAFGTDAHLRFSYALGEDSIREGIGRVRDLLATATPASE